MPRNAAVAYLEKWGATIWQIALTDQRLYQPFPKQSDTPRQYEQNACIAGLLCMDALVRPVPHQSWIDNRNRHDALKACMANTGTGVPILCVPARMTSLGTERIEKNWPEVHFILANACPPGDSNTHPSVVRIKSRNPVMFPKDQLTPSAEYDGLILEPFKVEAPRNAP
ncbi:MAG TPA: hypothetical protein VK776_02825 [Bryobacteraceae bacterium]|nr:hypothetical protein [Bryobacteraceae bacterium]